MKIEIDDYLLDNVFEELPGGDELDRAWFVSTRENDGWIILWENGETLHTYNYPPDWYAHG